MPLTDAAVKALKPAERVRRVSDGGGLYIEVAPTGTKTFRLAYRFDGKQRTKTLGHYPATKLVKARILREEVKGMVLEGIDPDPAAERRQKARRESEEPEEPGEEESPDQVPWIAITTRYLEKREREGSAPATMKKLRLHAELTFETFGRKPVGEVRATDVLNACRVYEAEGKLNSANAVRILCSQVFRFAIAHGLAEHDPAVAAKDALARPKDVGYAAVTDPDEVGELMRAIRGYPGDPVVRIGLLLSAYLFPRSGEIRLMRWDQIKQGIWHVPAEQMKMKREHLVPLPRQVRDLLQWTKGLTGGEELVLHSRMSRTGLMSENTFNHALRKIGYTSDRHVHHGFRTTASTNLNEMGWNSDWIERQLAHVPGNKVRGAYNKALYLEGRTEMMQAYADWLDAQADGRG